MKQKNKSAKQAEKNPGSDKKKMKQFSWLDRINISNQEKEDFLENLSMLIDSGMDLSSALRSIGEDLDRKSFARLVNDIRKSVDSGSYLWEALQSVDVFPSYVVTLIRMGEESGNLPKNLDLVVRERKKSREFKSKVRSAMLYPIFVLGLTLIVALGIAWFILPRLSSVFASLDMELPFITEWLIKSGEFLSVYGVFAVPLFLIFVGTCLFFIFGFSRTKFIGQAILLKLPGTGSLLKETELARFGFLFGSLLGAGMPIVKAMDSVANAADLRKFQKLYAHLRDELEAGNGFQESFDSYSKAKKLIPSSVQRLIVSGQNSGNLPKTFVNIGQRYEKRTETTTKNLAVILEPILLVIVWVGVVAVALAVILPIYSLIGGLNTSGVPQSSVETETEQTVPADSSETAETADQIPQESERVEILPTGLGYLNVRAEPTTASEQISRVEPGQSFELLDEQTGWYEIYIPADDITGWISAEYAEVVSSN